MSRGTSAGRRLVRWLLQPKTRFERNSSSSQARNRDSGSAGSRLRLLRLVSSRSVCGNQYISKCSLLAASSSKRSSASSQRIGASWAARVNSGSTRSVTEVRMPSAPRPIRASASTSGFSSASARSRVPSPGDHLEAGDLGAERGHPSSGPVGPGRDGTGDRLLVDVTHVVQRQAELLQGGVQLVQRRTGEHGDGHRVTVDADDTAQAVRAQQQAVGEGDVGEGVAGAGHLHREVLVAGRQHGVDHVSGVVRGELAHRVRRAQPRPVGPCAHARQVSPPPPGRLAWLPGGRAPRSRRPRRARPRRCTPSTPPTRSPRRPSRRPATHPARCRR